MDLAITSMRLCEQIAMFCRARNKIPMIFYETGFISQYQTPVSGTSRV